jgi:hypothetical protein
MSDRNGDGGNLAMSDSTHYRISYDFLCARDPDHYRGALYREGYAFEHLSGDTGVELWRSLTNPRALLFYLRYDSTYHGWPHDDKLRDALQDILNESRATQRTTTPIALRPAVPLLPLPDHIL